MTARGVQVADLAVLDPRHLRRRSDGERRRQGEDLLAEHREAGGERRVVVVRPETKLDAPIAARLSSNQPIHPWFMGSLDENDVLGLRGHPRQRQRLAAGLPVLDRRRRRRLPPAGRYYVSVDSGPRPVQRPLAGRYTLRSWVNDVRPPTVRILTKALSSGRPTVVAKITDAKSGSIRTRCSSSSARRPGARR